LPPTRKGPALLSEAGPIILRRPVGLSARVVERSQAHDASMLLLMGGCLRIELPRQELLDENAGIGKDAERVLTVLG
jgi:hypothetical protein